jgi:hypothetical protein
MMVLHHSSHSLLKAEVMQIRVTFGNEDHPSVTLLRGGH